jgi:predicted phage tail protein
MVSLIKVTNPFSRVDREYSVIDAGTKTLLDLRNETFPLDLDVSVTLNGKVIAINDLQYIKPKENDCILMLPSLTGGGDGGGKDILRAVAMIAVVAIALVLAVPSGGTSIFGTASLYAAGAVGTFGAAAIGMGVMLAGGLLINSLLPPSVVSTDLPNIGSGSGTSQTYSWNSKTTQQQGTVIPKIYGLNKCLGNVISTYIDTNTDDTQTLNVLLSLGLGPISRVYDFKINNQPIDELGIVVPFVKNGEITQTVVTGFDTTKTEYPETRIVTYATPVVYTTSGDDFDQLEIEVDFLNGLYYIDNNGDLISTSVDYRIEIKKSTEPDSSYIILSKGIATTQTLASGGKWYLVYLGDVWYDDSGPTSNAPGRYQIPNSSISSADLLGSWNPNNPEGWSEVQALAFKAGYPDSNPTDPYAHLEGEISPLYDFRGLITYWSYLNGIYETVTTFNNYKTVTSSSRSVVRSKDIYIVPANAHGTYDIRVTRLTADSDSTRISDKMYLSKITEVMEDAFTYPRIALVGLKAISSEVVSGSFDFSCLAEGALIRSYDGALYTVTYSNNPAWVCYDILTQPVVDNSRNIVRWDGIDPSRIVVDDFRSWADWCDTLITVTGTSTQEKRMTFNGIYDTEMNMWEAAWKVCEIARGCLVWRGTNLSVLIDKEEDPVQLFTVGNIGSGSFRETFLSMEDRASEIEVDFQNSAEDYERDKQVIINTNIDNPSNKVSLQLLGVTKASEAARIANFRLLCNQYLLRTIEFDVDIDAIACTVGDVIRVQHDIPQWGAGGRLVSAEASSVVLDKEVTIEDSPHIYELIVRLSTDTVVTKEVDTTITGTVSTINVTVPFASLPSTYDVYAFGESLLATKDFRITNISRAGDQVCSIKALEYNSLIYAED